MKWSEDWEKVWKEKSVKSDKSQFDLYNCIKTELVKRGIPADEICYIHDANSDVQKSKMFDDMNSGKNVLYLVLQVNGNWYKHTETMCSNA